MRGKLRVLLQKLQQANYFVSLPNVFLLNKGYKIEQGSWAKLRKKKKKKKPQKPYFWHLGMEGQLLLPLHWILSAFVWSAIILPKRGNVEHHFESVQKKRLCYRVSSQNAQKAYL